MFIRTNLFLMALFLLALAAPAFAQQSCGPRDAVASHLGTRYSEAQTGAGLSGERQPRIIEVWASDEGSWTILATNADGVSCIIAAGSHWREVDPVELSGIPG